MDPDLSALDSFLADAGDDGYLIDADSSDSDQRYLSGFDAHDPFFTLFTGETHLLVSGLEYGRAKKESRADSVSRYADYDYQYGSPEERDRMLADFLVDHGVSSLSVPARFPLASADGLRERDIGVEAETDGVLTGIRATKTDAEIESIRDAQRANERAMERAETLLREASVEDGLLIHDGRELTSERVRREIEIALLERDHALDETIVACGIDAADPHDGGSGPLRSNETIVIDVFPKNKATNYHADMTRTFSVGEPSARAREWYDLTAEAKEAALAAVEPGVTGEEVHDAVCDVYEDAGLPTLRENPATETGFIHSTGHGIGLDVHELPRLAPGGAELKPGHVITVEPGLYDPEVGGVRIEDLVAVTEDGCENLTDYPEELVL
ncbi:M24 family metallopeptidase [Halalkalicoccus jeotgali]|uniref:Peptidase M24 n=1 Tax=Halalkalicoccus jeotgali (strain DSM 18796 / CECT 7217 / JCM 14584 / KCTC 4019 / B3) TaxID=795797 RepID=D8J2P0_HALJB|nr:Xaa-Pro peptidase family protein [Halalkalicoccus jeotgali]ADJ14997.1 X-Pro aminopeptidase [Halalkalicoccus jeotgali B3]ELY34987.1 peptidase M24 [Halalkalicoccus jeotgali B3]